MYDYFCRGIVYYRIHPGGNTLIAVSDVDRMLQTRWSDGLGFGSWSRTTVHFFANAQWMQWNH